MFEMFAFLLALLAAFLRAARTSLIKFSSDGYALFAVLNGFNLLVALCLLPFVPPPNVESFIYLGISAVAYTGLVFLTLAALKHADLSLYYPVDAGALDIFLVVFGLIALQETLGLLNSAGLALVFLSLPLLMEPGKIKEGLRSRAFILSVLSGFVNGIMFSADTIGIRVSGNPFSYIVYNMLVVIPAILIAIPRMRGRWLSTFRKEPGTIAFATIADAGSYYIFLFILYGLAVTKALPLFHLEIVFSALIAAFLLRERVTFRRWVAAILITLAVTLTQSGG